MRVVTHYATLPLPSDARNSSRKGPRPLKIDGAAVRRLSEVPWLARPINEIYQTIPLLAAPSRVHAA